mmetsp:Transcript_33451/g.62188  ORF Transcript_33451/g.62188 Transcript_33451/m.62188 type:complete len:86 (+) Transcript_33451:337-594(+)
MFTLSNNEGKKRQRRRLLQPRIPASACPQDKKPFDNDKKAEDNMLPGSIKEVGSVNSINDSQVAFVEVLTRCAVSSILVFPRRAV